MQTRTVAHAPSHAYKHSHKRKYLSATLLPQPATDPALSLAAILLELNTRRGRETTDGVFEGADDGLEETTDGVLEETTDGALEETTDGLLEETTDVGLVETTERVRLSGERLETGDRSGNMERYQVLATRSDNRWQLLAQNTKRAPTTPHTYTTAQCAHIQIIQYDNNNHI